MTKKPSKTLGERLKDRRWELGLNLEDVAQDLGVSISTVSALENDKYEFFSAKVYALGSLKKLLFQLKIEEVEPFLKEFNAEWDVKTFHKKVETVSLPSNRGNGPYLTPQRLVTGTIVFMVLALLIFLGIRFRDFVGPPTLTIIEPESVEKVLEAPILRIKGKVERESNLTVNGREITLDEIGSFNEEIELLPGLNSLEFIAEDRFGKSTKEVRYVLVK